MSSMRKVVVLGLLAGLVAALLRRGRADTAPTETVAVGFEDGSSTTLEPGSPERELILAAATEALA